jgi:hypothetical protein
LTRSFSAILRKKMTAGASLRSFFMLVYPQKFHAQNCQRHLQGMAGGDPARQKREQSCRLVSFFNEAGQRLPPLQATKPYAQPPLAVFFYTRFRK